MDLVGRGCNTRLTWAPPLGSSRSLGDQRPGNGVPNKEPPPLGFASLCGFERSCQGWLQSRGTNASAPRGAWAVRQEQTQEVAGPSPLAASPWAPSPGRGQLLGTRGRPTAQPIPCGDFLLWMAGPSFP